MAKAWVGDDVENDWLAKELKEENYHGCMAHSGAHPLEHAPDRELGQGFMGRAMHQENYRACAEHGGIHDEPERPHSDAERLKRQAGETLRRAMGQSDTRQNSTRQSSYPARRMSAVTRVILIIVFLNIFLNLVGAFFGMVN